MNLRVMPARLLPLNRPHNGIPPCLKEGGVWERSHKQCPFFPSLFICSRRDQFWTTVCSHIRAGRIRNLCCVIYPYPALCCRSGAANGGGGALQTPWALQPHCPCPHPCLHPCLRSCPCANGKPQSLADGNLWRSLALGTIHISAKSGE